MKLSLWQRIMIRLIGYAKDGPNHYWVLCREHGYQLSLEHGYSYNGGTWVSCPICDRRPRRG